MTHLAIKLLDGYELEYTYTDGGAVVLTFYDGMLKYRWLSGPFEGVEESDKNYQSTMIRDGLYLVNWHDSENSNFVTQAIDLEDNILHATAIIGYGTADEIVLFERATIERVTK